MERYKREALAEKISRAFAKTPPPKYKKAIASEDALQRAFEGKKWQEISPEILGRFAHDISLFSYDAFRYYLPPFLIGVVLYAEEVGSLRDSLVFFLIPELEEGWGKIHFLGKAELMSYAERNAVHEFLIAYAELEPDMSWNALKKRKRELQRAIDFWGR